MTSDDAVRRVAHRLPTRFLRTYARAKLRSDPVYGAVAERLRDHALPLFDLGCGVGLLEFYLRELGHVMPITGIDHDTRKIGVAADVGRSYSGLSFRRGDAREPLPSETSVVAIDILHYFRDSEQHAIVDSIAAAVPHGGVAIIRDAVRDGSRRYRITAAQETFSRLIRWLRAERLNFPTAEVIVEPFRRRGFLVEVMPLWGRTPFNNYLFVFRRSVSGTTHV